MRNEKIYPGIYNDVNGGMTDVGRIIKDAWLFDIIPEEETCEGWTKDRVQIIYDQVEKAWEPYGKMVSALPSELQEKFMRINDAAIERAKAAGWNPELGDDD